MNSLTIDITATQIYILVSTLNVIVYTDEQKGRGPIQRLTFEKN